MAIDLAKQGLYTTTPNPRVGCVIVKNGTVIGEGFHAKAGEPHAEVFALKQAGSQAQGATAYVTLEPCSHTGRTPPCADALLQHQLARVVVAMQDPNPLVSGAGVARLRAAGMTVDVGVLEQQARDLNPGFIQRMTHGKPWVRLKAAISIDGFVALPDGTSQWITGEAARLDGHHWRARACAILTGIGTVREDNPLLNVRGVDTSRQPIKIVVDSHLDIDPAARVLESGKTWIAHAVSNVENNPALASKVHALQERGVELLYMPNSSGKVELKGLMQLLAARDLNEIHVEAGHKLNGSLISEGCVDELLIYQAPCLLGQGLSMASLKAVGSLDQRYAFECVDIARFGPDTRMRFVRQLS